MLSQVDSSIGGKNGINNRFGKNLVGTFYQPDLIITDTNYLKSLPKRQIKSGYAEIFKHSIIKDKKVLYDNGLISNINVPVKILANGELNTPININVEFFSSSAKLKIEKAGGKAESI